MNHRAYGLGLAVLALCAAGACSKSNPVSPSTTAAATSAVVDPSLTASVATPRPLTPSNGASIPNLQQPVTLTVLNAIVTKPG
ncbi:MAG TPA: hypothetical protein VKI43_13100, partial [Vicinamibacterales bacterium]|nr:hypothetical protein [Vicinamibacterales bacterium]